MTEQTVTTSPGDLRRASRAAGNLANHAAKLRANHATDAHDLVLKAQECLALAATNLDAAADAMGQTYRAASRAERDYVDSLSPQQEGRLDREWNYRRDHEAWLDAQREPRREWSL